MVLIDHGQDCVQDALAYMYRRILLSIEPPEVACILAAKHLVTFGHKYGVWVLLEEGQRMVQDTPFPHNVMGPCLPIGASNMY